MQQRRGALARSGRQRHRVTSELQDHTLRFTPDGRTTREEVSSKLSRRCRPHIEAKALAVTSQTWSANLSSKRACSSAEDVGKTRLSKYVVDSWPLGTELASPCQLALIPPSPGSCKIFKQNSLCPAIPQNLDTNRVTSILLRINDLTNGLGRVDSYTLFTDGLLISPSARIYILQVTLVDSDFQRAPEAGDAESPFQTIPLGAAVKLRKYMSFRADNCPGHLP
jgi:hypothetical protein